MNTRSLYMAMVVASLCLGTSLVWAQGDSDKGIGLYTAVQGAVTVTHSHMAKTLPVNVDDEVLFKDLIQTRIESRTKAFFEDDSILTVGENSRVEITEHIYNPDRNMRRLIVKLVQGRVRALVAKVFNGPGSAFEIHTPTAVVAARGTYFVVWVEHGVTGIVNIGNAGRVDFTSEGKTVSVEPGNYSVAAAGGPPAQPLVYDAGPGIGGVARAEKTVTLQAAQSENIAETVEKTASIVANARNAIEGTVLKDAPRLETARDTMRASHIPVLETSAVPVKQAAQADPNATSPSQTMPTVPVTPPAPISRAADNLIPRPPVVPPPLQPPPIEVPPLPPGIEGQPPPPIIEGVTGAVGKLK